MASKLNAMYKRHFAWLYLLSLSYQVINHWGEIQSYHDTKPSTVDQIVESVCDEWTEAMYPSFRPFVCLWYIFHCRLSVHISFCLLRSVRYFGQLVIFQTPPISMSQARLSSWTTFIYTIMASFIILFEFNHFPNAISKRVSYQVKNLSVSSIFVILQHFLVAQCSDVRLFYQIIRMTIISPSSNIIFYKICSYTGCSSSIWINFATLFSLSIPTINSLQHVSYLTWFSICM